MKQKLLIALTCVLIGLFILGTINPTSATALLSDSYPPPIGTISPTKPILENSLPIDYYVAYPVPNITQTSQPPSQGENPASDPTLDIEEPSIAAQNVLAYVSYTKSIPLEFLEIYTDRTIELPNTGRQFQVVTLIDNRPQGVVYKLMVDLENWRMHENSSELAVEEIEAQRQVYGKLHPDLYNKLQNLEMEDFVEVQVWLNIPDSMTLDHLEKLSFETLAQKYPEARQALEKFTKPFDIQDRELGAQIEAEYHTLINTKILSLVDPWLAELSTQGIQANYYSGIPAFTCRLSKQSILSLSLREGIDTIYLFEGTLTLNLDQAITETRAPEVWSRNINGDGIIIAILESTNIDPNNMFISLLDYRPGFYGTTIDHATVVASIAASFNDSYRGVSSGAQLLSAGSDVTPTDTIDAMIWSLNLNANIINMSAGFDYSNNYMYPLDKDFDTIAREHNCLIISASGNTGSSILSPGKGWNVLTVGGFDDKRDSNPTTYSMYDGSSYKNPVSFHDDREKPEVVAAAVGIVTLGLNGVVSEGTGTSLSAPQVSGLAALLMSRNSDLISWPEAIRAIIMASANRNIEGPSIIIGPDDLSDGAGAINAAIADQIAQNRGENSDTIPCNSSCWWGQVIFNSNFPVGDEIIRKFHVDNPAVVRVVITWLANPNGSNYNIGKLDTDLDLRINAPDGNPIQGAVSLSYDNNYEMIEFPAQYSGEYSIRIRNASFEEVVNYLAIAVAIIPIQVFLPIITK